MAGADANPYLALAAVLAAVHHGITEQARSRPAMVGDGYAAPPTPGATCACRPTGSPPSICSAVSEVLKDYLGERFVRMFTTVKRTEQARFFDIVTPLDYDWYLRNA